MPMPRLPRGVGRVDASPASPSSQDRRRCRAGPHRRAPSSASICRRRFRRPRRGSCRARRRDSCRRAPPRHHSAWRGCGRRSTGRADAGHGKTKGDLSIALLQFGSARTITRLRPRSAAGAALRISAVTVCGPWLVVCRGSYRVGRQLHRLVEADRRQAVAHVDAVGGDDLRAGIVEARTERLACS